MNRAFHWVGMRIPLMFCVTAFAFLAVIMMPLTARASDGDGGDMFENLKRQAETRKRPAARRSSTNRVTPKRGLKRRSVKRRRVVRMKRKLKPQKIRNTQLVKRLHIKWWLKPLNDRFVPGEILITVKPGTDLVDIAELAQKHRLHLLAAERNKLLESRIYFLDYSHDMPVREMAELLRAESSVVSAQPNYLYATQQAKSGGAKARKNYNLQYALKNLGVAEAHDLLTGNDIIVAVIDAQMDLDHPELDGAVSHAFNAINRGGTGKANAHGTAIGSIIAARHQLTGIAPGARIASARAFTMVSRFGPSLGTTRSLLKAVDWAFALKARIFNLSFAGPEDPLFLRALQRISDSGAILIASAGNEGERSPALYPAAAEMVIAVTALNQKDNLFIAASHGDYVEMASPGVDILVAMPDRRYGFMSGTSMAAAHVSGIAALILEHNPNIPAALLRKILRSTADDLGRKGRDDLFGVGRANASAAIKAALQ